MRETHTRCVRLGRSATVTPGSAAFIPLVGPAAYS